MQLRHVCVRVDGSADPGSAMSGLGGTRETENSCFIANGAHQRSLVPRNNPDFFIYEISGSSCSFPTPEEPERRFGFGFHLLVPWFLATEFTRSAARLITAS